jgi:thymidylate kinase
MARKRTLLVALEGIDGTGKSVHTKLLGEQMAEWGISATVFHYTGIRRDMVGTFITMAYKGQNRNAFWNVVSRFRLLQELAFVVQAQMNYRDLGDTSSYQVILCDRSAITAYVAHFSFVGIPCFDTAILDFLERKFVPDYSIWLSISPSEAIRRISKQNRGHWQDENAALLQAMSDRYAELFAGRNVPRILRDVNWFRIDAQRTFDEVHADISWQLKQIICKEEHDAKM